MRYIALEEAVTVPGIPEIDPGESLSRFGIGLRPELVEDFARRLPDVTRYRIPAMDVAGVDVQVLSLTPPGVQTDLTPAAAVHAARRVNDHLAGLVAEHPARLAAFATLPLQDPDAAVTELHRAVGELGLRGALVNDWFDGHFLDEPRFDRVWAALAELRVPLYLHPGVPVGNWPVLDLAEYLRGAMWSWQASTGGHAMRIVCGGVFDRHPGATMVLGHMGEFLPFQATRFDSRWATLQHAHPLCRKPSEYFGSNVVITTTGVFAPPVLRAAIDVLGAGAVLFAADYPYESQADSVALIEKTDLTDDERHAVAHGNAERLLGLP